MRKEAKRWLKQAEFDIKAARDSLKDGNYNWSCFQSQQSAEKALKSFLYNFGYTSIYTHSVKILLNECKKLEKSFSQLLEYGKILDMFYIPTRYPNGLDTEIVPSEYFDKEDSEKCLNCAILILEKVKKFLKE